MTLVLDASVAVAWFIADEDSELSTGIRRAVANDGAHVPVLWHIEVSNALTMAMRRKRISEFDWVRSLDGVKATHVTVDALEMPGLISRLTRLVKFHGLTFYDAAYLDLAIRTGLPLATFDDELCAAAANEGIPLWQDVTVTTRAADD